MANGRAVTSIMTWYNRYLHSVNKAEKEAGAALKKKKSSKLNQNKTKI